MKNNKAGKTDLVTAIVLIVGGLAALSLLGVIDIDGFTIGGGAPADDGADDGIVQVCSTSDPVTVTLNGQDAFAPSTAVNGHLVYYLDKSGNWQFKSTTHYSSAKTFTVSPGSKIKVMWAENSTVHYTKVKTYDVPCESNLELTEKLVPIQAATWGASSVFNHDGTKNSATAGQDANQTMAAGQSYTVKIWLQNTYKKWIGNPYYKGTEGATGLGSNVFSCIYNSTLYDSLDLPGYSKVGNPDILPSTEFANTKWISWGVPLIGTNTETLATEPTNNGLQLSLVIKVDSARTPDAKTEKKLGSDGDIYCVLNDFDFDRHAVTDALLIDTEDEDDNNLGETTIPLNVTIQVDS